MEKGVRDRGGGSAGWMGEWVEGERSHRAGGMRERGGCRAGWMGEWGE